MSDCEVTLLPSGVSLVRAISVRLTFLLVSVERSLGWLSCLFFALGIGVGAASPALARPVQLAPGCDRLLCIMCVWPFNSVSAVGVIVGTPGGLPTLSGFSALISAGWNIVRRFVNKVPLRLRPKPLSSYKVQLVHCITLLSDCALDPSCHSFARIRPAYSCQGPRSSTAEGQWSHLRSKFKLHPPCEL